MPIRTPYVCKCSRVVPAGVRCECSRKLARERKARFDDVRPSARERGYNSRWEKARATWLLKNPVCSWPGCSEPATVVDHIIPHRGDQKLFWDSESNWAGLCAHHHNASKQKKERLSAEYGARAHPFLPKPVIPVTMVCGPAGAGKSTYVDKHKGYRDLVIDLDLIRAEIAGTGIHQPNEVHTAAALERRNEMLRSLSKPTIYHRAWFIIGAPTREERETWQHKLNARVVLLDTPLHECIRRIRNDPRRAGQRERMIEYATSWWDRYTPGRGDELLNRVSPEPARAGL